MGSDAAALQKASETMSSDAATVSPIESEIAAVAYQLWLDSACPVGSDREYRLRAEAMIKNALAAKREDLSIGPSIPRYDTRTESEIVVELQWEGHWEVWEREWGDARWIWD
jgi:hypothetical protein